jgi:uncharacterized membrane protein
VTVLIWIAFYLVVVIVPLLLIAAILMTGWTVVASGAVKRLLKRR